MIPQLKGSWLLKETLAALDDDTVRILVHQGGSRTTKTYSVAQAVASWIAARPGLTIDVVRKHHSDLEGTAKRDIIDILKSIDIYRDEWHQKTLDIFTFPATRSQIRFGGLVSSRGSPNDALKGQSRDILWWNEPTDGTAEDWQQLSMRTSKLIILDYNPDYAHHWIYDQVLPRDDCKLIVSTWHTGVGYVPQGQLEEIKRRVPVYLLPGGQHLTDWKGEYDGPGTILSGDPSAWDVYGLGRRGVISGAIYPLWHHAAEMPASCKVAYGLDFGFSNPATLTRCGWRDAEPEPELYWEEIIYRAGMTNPVFADLILEHAPELRRGMPGGMQVFCDSAEPKSIQELYNAGINARFCDKKTSVWEQIKWVKKHRLHIVGESPNLKREIRAYKRKTDRAGNLLDAPLDVDDHSLDAGRYGSWTAWGTRRAPSPGLVSTSR